MVHIVFQDDVKQSFSRVKEDILSLKRSLNRELLTLEEVSSRMQGLVAKDEFYSFIKRLGERLDKIESNLEIYTGFDEDIKDAEAHIKSLGKKIERRENLAAELKEIQRVSGKLAALESSTVPLNAFNDQIAAVSRDIAQVKRTMLTAKAHEGSKQSVADLGSRLEQLEKKAASNTTVTQAAQQTAAQLREEMRHQSEQEQKKRAASEDILRSEIARATAPLVPADTFTKKTNELKKELSTLQALLNRSMSEVDLSDYSTKKELNKEITQLRLAATKEKDDVQQEMSRMLAEQKENAQAMQTAAQQTLSTLTQQISTISQAVEALKADSQKTAEGNNKRISQELQQLQRTMAREMAAALKEQDKKIQQAFKQGAREPKREARGTFARIGSGIAAFFKEEERENGKKEEKEKEEESAKEKASREAQEAAAALKIAKATAAEEREERKKAEKEKAEAQRAQAALEKQKEKEKEQQREKEDEEKKEKKEDEANKDKEKQSPLLLLLGIGFLILAGILLYTYFSGNDSQEPLGAITGEEENTTSSEATIGTEAEGTIIPDNITVISPDEENLTEPITNSTEETGDVESSANESNLATGNTTTAPTISESLLESRNESEVTTSIGAPPFQEENSTLIINATPAAQTGNASSTNYTRNGNAGEEKKPLSPNYLLVSGLILVALFLVYQLISRQQADKESAHPSQPDEQREKEPDKTTAKGGKNGKKEKEAATAVNGKGNDVDWDQPVNLDQFFEKKR